MNKFLEKSIEFLEKYVDTCVEGFFPFELRGDPFFDLIDPWLKDFDVSAPRSEQVIKNSMMRDVLLNPAFDSLHELPEYQRLVQKMNRFIE
ncbi:MULTISPECIES: hypothetical protein [unclassified Paenibacillus]|uniref:hypothetical protein n=1 Tax=unclassified Paenibacillus TaxID=185978 RepID=UPI00210DF3BF|nr:hypothetical protein [Paenibacillus sp. OK076]